MVVVTGGVVEEVVVVVGGVGRGGGVGEGVVGGGGGGGQNKKNIAIAVVWFQVSSGCGSVPQESLPQDPAHPRTYCYKIKTSKSTCGFSSYGTLCCCPV